MMSSWLRGGSEHSGSSGNQRLPVTSPSAGQTGELVWGAGDWSACSAPLGPRWRSGVNDGGSEVKDGGSRVKGRVSGVGDCGSEVEGSGSGVEDCGSEVGGSRVEGGGRGSGSVMAVFAPFPSCSLGTTEASWGLGVGPGGSEWAGPLCSVGAGPGGSEGADRACSTARLSSWSKEEELELLL